MRRILRECPKMRILVFSVHESDQTIREILSSGAHGYLSKAKAGEKLVQVVKLLLSGKTFYPEKAAASWLSFHLLPIRYVADVEPGCKCPEMARLVES